MKEEREEGGRKYYKTKEEIYKKFNFNGDEKELEEKFKKKNEQILKDKTIKEEQQKVKVKKFIDTLKRLENPFINSLFSETPTPKQHPSHQSLKPLSR